MADGNDNIAEYWSVVCSELKKELGDPVISSWIAPLRFDGYVDKILHLNAPTAFLRDWVVNNYVSKIVGICVDKKIPIEDVKISVEVAKQPEAKDSKFSQVALQFTDTSEEKDGFSLPLDPDLTFEKFIVGKPNELAYAAAQRVAESDSIVYNPLFLYGGVGLGKTHLMHAIAWRIREKNKDKSIAYMSAEKFMHQFIRSVRFKDTVAFKEQFSSVDVLMIDDIQFICGKDSTQEEFFHTFNSLVDNNRQVIISADKSPTDLEDMEERLKSRLGWGLVADIHPTTYELRLGILQSKLSVACVNNPGLKIPTKVLEFIAHRVTSNVRELEGALNRVIASAVFLGREVSVDSAREVLSDLVRASDRVLTIEEIQKKVANHYDIKFSDMFSSKRSKGIAVPRQIAMYLCKQLTSMSLPDIGRGFGGRDHTTVLHAVRKIQDAYKNDKNVHDDVELLTKILQN
jgi:chromosomal replication initiator protein